MQTLPPANLDFSIYFLSEQAVTLEFGDSIDWNLLQGIIAFNKLLEQQPFPGLVTTVQAYTTLSIFFDVVTVINGDLPGKTCFDKVSGYLRQLKETPQADVPVEHPIITIPVCYGGEFGPDLDELAAMHQLGVEEVIRLHSEATYKVYMIGFVPGFAYMGGLPDVLDTPRKTTPRKTIPPGAVGIAGKQTGIYPLETPGGWQLIGRTPLKLFDPKRSQPSLLKAGDGVKFQPVDQVQFGQFIEQQNAVADH